VINQLKTPFLCASASVFMMNCGIGKYDGLRLIEPSCCVYGDWNCSCFLLEAPSRCCDDI